MPQPLSQSVLVTRTVLWVVLSSVFIYTNSKRIAFERAHGVTPGLLSYSLLGVWVVALVFWLYTGWRDWTRRPR